MAARNDALEKEMTENGSEETTTEEAGTPIRAAIILFVATLVLLFVMAVVWLWIRVEPPATDGQEPASVSMAFWMP